jgi:nitrite reductase (NO-forming)
MNAFMAGNNNLEVTNGMAFKYAPGVGAIAKIPLNEDAKPLMVKPGELTRWYVVNGGPNQFLAFHFISGQMDVRDGFIKNRYGTQDKNDETWTIPPGSASVIEATFPAEGPYVGLTHKLNDVVKGGAFVVIGANNSTMDDIPPEAMVPEVGTGQSMNATETSAAETPGNVTSTTNMTSTGNETSTGNQTSGNQTGTNSTG